MSETNERTVREATRDLLRQLGLTTVFGNPGTTEVPMLADWPDDFRYVLGLQESAVVGMADGHATETGAPVLVSLHSAGGTGHALGAVFSAYRNRTPLVLVAGQQSRSLLPQDPFLGATEATSFPRPYVKWAAEPARAADVPDALARAHQAAVQPPCGPTFVSVPVDDWDQPAEPIPQVHPLPAPQPDPSALADLAGALERCRRPAFVVGPAVAEDGAVGELVALAERARAAVWAAPMSSRAAFPEGHALFQGFLQPEQRGIAETLGAHDLVVVFGAPAFTYHVDRGRTEREWPPIYLLSDDPEVLARLHGGRGIAGGVGAGLRQLLPQVEAADRPAPPPRERPEPGPEPAGTPTAAHVVRELAGVLPDDAVVVEEAPTHRWEIQNHLPINAPEQHFLTTASGALGYGLSAAVGAALAGSRPVVAVIGDGSAMYSVQALWTAARERAPMTVLVLDNAEYAAVRLLGQAGDLPGVELGGIDFGAVARGLGCSAERVERLSELVPALKRSFAAEGPTVLHVPVTRSAQKLY